MAVYDTGGGGQTQSGTWHTLTSLDLGHADECVTLYCLDRDGIHEVYKLLQDQLEPRAPSSCNIPLLQQVWLALPCHREFRIRMNYF